MPDKINYAGLLCDAFHLAMMPESPGHAAPFSDDFVLTNRCSYKLLLRVTYRASEAVQTVSCERTARLFPKP